MSQTWTILLNSLKEIYKWTIGKCFYKSLNFTFISWSNLQVFNGSFLGHFTETMVQMIRNNFKKCEVHLVGNFSLTDINILSFQCRVLCVKLHISALGCFSKKCYFFHKSTLLKVFCKGTSTYEWLLTN